MSAVFLSGRPSVFEPALHSTETTVQWAAVSESKPSRWRYVAPNFITCVGLSIALLSIMNSLSGQYEDAAWLILLCCLLDKLDGTIARVLNGTSAFGVQMDSFSDLISFGFAPGMLILGLMTGDPQFSPYYPVNSAMFWALRAGVMFLVIMSVIRLAKFNVLTERIGSKLFLGIPTTLVGALLASFILTAIEYEWPVEIIAYSPLALFVMGLWMVSNIRLPKVTKTASLGYNIFLGVNVVLTWICVPARIYPEYILLLSGGYAVIGTIYATLFMDLPEDAPEEESV